MMRLRRASVIATLSLLTSAHRRKRSVRRANASRTKA